MIILIKKDADPTQVTVEVQVGEDQTLTVKDFTKFFDVDYLSALLKEYKN